MTPYEFHKATDEFMWWYSLVVLFLFPIGVAYVLSKIKDE